MDAVRELGWRASVGAPLIVEGRLWGVLIVGSTTDRPLSGATQRRLAEFAALKATAIANAESRAELNASRARIVATADATRRRIERDLHDVRSPPGKGTSLQVDLPLAAAPS